MNDAQDFYRILGVPANANLETIRNAYRTLAVRLGSDKNAAPGADVQFRDIAAAYAVLNDPDLKQKYDLTRRNAPPKQFFTLRVTPSKRVLPAIDEVQVLYLLIELLPEQSRSAQGSQTHLNLTLVLDHSLSMKQEKRLERTKNAAYKIIDTMTDQDYLSVVAFSDHAEVLIEAAKVTDKAGLRAPIMAMQPFGGTEMFQGLQTGYFENQRNANTRYVNHIVLLTDGRTYGDEHLCLELAEHAAKDGIGISAMGIGHEWNDVFLDQLVAPTGGACEFISTPNQVVKFMDERVKTLSSAFAERITMSLAPDPDVKIESVFRLSPHPQPLSAAKDPIALGQLQSMGSISVIIQLQIPSGQKVGTRSLLRVDMTSDIMMEQALGHKTIADISAEFAETPKDEEPPLLIVDALGKLTLYRMQEKARDALARGDAREATRKLEALATRLFSAGHEELAQAARDEAARVSQTQAFSDQGEKALKFGTRLLMEAPQGEREGD